MVNYRFLPLAPHCPALWIACVGIPGHAASGAALLGAGVGSRAGRRSGDAVAVGSGRTTAPLPGRAAAGPFTGAPTLDVLMPWSVSALKTGRDWVRAPDKESLTARWRRLADAPAAQRSTLFRPSRARDLKSTVSQLPGQRTPATRLLREVGPCPPPVRVRHGAFDRLWLLPDQRLLDRARPELWRVADDEQVFAVIHPGDPQHPGPAVTFSAELPDGHRPKRQRPGGQHEIVPAYRRPGGRDANLAPGLTDHLAARLNVDVTAADVVAWIAAVGACPGAVWRDDRPVIPISASPTIWAEGVALGRRVLWLHTYGARCADPAEDRPAERPRMPGGRRPFVRRAVSAHDYPRELRYDIEDEALVLGDGRITPVPPTAWHYRVGGSPVLREWFARRCQEPTDSGSLEAIRPRVWPAPWTTDLIEVASVLALLAELHPAQAALLTAVRTSPLVTADELHQAGVLPTPGWCARPASVLSLGEEGPEGQFPLF